MAKFKLPEVHAGKSMILLDRYPFVDGEMRVSNADALKMAPVLVRLYECSVEMDVEVAIPQPVVEGSLGVNSTKNGEAESKALDNELEALSAANTLAKAQNPVGQAKDEAAKPATPAAK